MIGLGIGSGAGVNHIKGLALAWVPVVETSTSPVPRDIM